MEEKRFMLAKEYETLLLLGCDDGFLGLVTTVVGVMVVAVVGGGEGEMTVGFVDGTVVAQGRGVVVSLGLVGNNVTVFVAKVGCAFGRSYETVN